MKSEETRLEYWNHILEFIYFVYGRHLSIILSCFLDLEVNPNFFRRIHATKNRLKRVKISCKSFVLEIRMRRFLSQSAIHFKRTRINLRWATKTQYVNTQVSPQCLTTPALELHDLTIPRKHLTSIPKSINDNSRSESLSLPSMPCWAPDVESQ